MNSGPTLSVGSTGEDVRRMQRILVMIKGFDWDEIDGIFGPKTESAVKWFQESEGLVVDGMVGPATWGAMPADPNTPQLAAGATGPVVSALQQALHAYGGQGAPTDPGSVDGIFGPKTEAGVQAYQGERDVEVDGIVGDRTVGDRTWWVPAGGAGATLASIAGLTTA